MSRLPAFPPSRLPAFPPSRLPAFVSAGVLLLSACLGEGSFGVSSLLDEDSSASLSEDTGTLSIVLHDDPSPDIAELWLVIVEVNTHSIEDGWRLVTSREHRFDLLALHGGFARELGSSRLPPGSYDAIEIVVADAWIVDEDGLIHALDLPEDGTFALEHPFELQPCTFLTLDVDWDGEDAVTMNAEGRFQLNGSIEIEGEGSEAIPCDTPELEDSIASVKPFDTGDVFVQILSQGTGGTKPPQAITPSEEEDDDEEHEDDGRNPRDEEDSDPGDRNGSHDKIASPITLNLRWSIMEIDAVFVTPDPALPSPKCGTTLCPLTLGARSFAAVQQQASQMSLMRVVQPSQPQTFQVDERFEFVADLNVLKGLKLLLVDNAGLQYTSYVDLNRALAGASVQGMEWSLDPASVIPIKGPPQAYPGEVGPPGWGCVDWGSGPRRVDFEILHGEAVYQGDLILGDAADLLASQGQCDPNAKSAGPALLNRRWPNNVVPYEIGSQMLQDERDAIIGALRDLGDRTSATFPHCPNDNCGADPNTSNYLHFAKDHISPNACKAMNPVGMHKGGGQRIYFAQKLCDRQNRNTARSSPRHGLLPRAIQA